MTRDEIDHAIRSILGVVLQRDLPAGANVVRAEEPNWDSLKHVEILFAIEDTLQVRFEEYELPELNSLDKLVAGVERHRAS